MVNVENINKLIGFMEAETHPWDIVDPETCFIGQVDACFPCETEGPIVANILGINVATGLLMPPAYDSPRMKDAYPRSRAIAQLKHIRDNNLSQADWDATPLQTNNG